MSSRRDKSRKGAFSTPPERVSTPSSTGSTNSDGKMDYRLGSNLFAKEEVNGAELNANHSLHARHTPKQRSNSEFGLNSYSEKALAPSERRKPKMEIDKYSDRHKNYYLTPDGIYQGQWQNELRHGTGTLFAAKASLMNRYSPNSPGSPSVSAAGYTANARRRASSITSNNTIESSSCRRRPSSSAAFPYCLVSASDCRHKLYEGHWSNGLPDGFGTKYFASGDVYYGVFAAGVRHGWGVYNFRNGDRFSGHWCQGEMDGEGRFSWENGDVYDGEWKHSKMHGNGKKTHCDGSIVEGRFHCGLLNGMADKTYANGDIYKGNYKHDKRHGYGVYLWATGSCYKGMWRHDAMAGVGLFTNDALLSIPPRLNVNLPVAVEPAFVTETDDGDWNHLAPPEPPEPAVTSNGPIRMLPTRFLHRLHCCDLLGRDPVQSYFGQHGANSKREGFGVAKYWNGNSYRGGWGDGSVEVAWTGITMDGPNGWGRMEYEYGAVYVGMFVEGLPHGSGTWFIGQFDIDAGDSGTHDETEAMHTWQAGQVGTSASSAISMNSIPETAIDPDINSLEDLLGSAIHVHPLDNTIREQMLLTHADIIPFLMRLWRGGVDLPMDEELLGCAFAGQFQLGYPDGSGCLYINQDCVLIGNCLRGKFIVDTAATS